MPATTENPISTIAATFAPSLTIEGKWFGKGSKSLFPNFQMPLPPAWETGTAISLKDLLDAVVRQEVANFNDRQQYRTVLQSLSAVQISEGAAKGKINTGLLGDAPQTADADESVAVALQAFLDGNYFVFVDDDQKTELSDTFFIRPETRVTFLRLVALAGG